MIAGDARDPDGQPAPAGGPDRDGRAGRRAAVQGRPVARRGPASSTCRPPLRGRRPPRAARDARPRALTIARDANAMNELALADCRARERLLDRGHRSTRRARTWRKRRRRSRQANGRRSRRRGDLPRGRGKAAAGDGEAGFRDRAAQTRGRARRRSKPRKQQQLGVTNSLAEVLRLSGRTREAVPYFRRILADLEAMGYAETEAFPNVVELPRDVAGGSWRVRGARLDAFGDSSANARRHTARAECRRCSRSCMARAKLRLGAIDSADVWLARAHARHDAGCGAVRRRISRRHWRSFGWSSGGLAEARAGGRPASCRPPRAAGDCRDASRSPPSRRRRRHAGHRRCSRRSSARC